MTKTNDATGDRLFYDGDCPLCADWAGRFRDVLQRAGFTTATLPSRAGTREFTEMVVEMPGERSFGGADGLVQIARRVWWAWPLFALAQIPGAMGLLPAGYRRLAANRHCLDGERRVPSRKSPGRWLPLICLPIAALFLRDDFPGWAFMWTMALAFFAGSKWLTFSEARQHSPATRGAWETGYLLAWPGMDAAAFLSRGAPVARPRAGGSDLARAVCAFLAIFWMVRLVAASLIFDLRPYLTTRFRRIGYQATNVAFAYLPVVYAWVAWKGGTI